METNSSKFPFGVTVKEIIYVTVLGATIIINGHGAFEQIGKNTENIQKTAELLTTFIRNSDGYHSAATGSQFEFGKPSNNKETLRIRKFLDAPVEAGK